MDEVSAEIREGAARSRLAAVQMVAMASLTQVRSRAGVAHVRLCRQRRSAAVAQMRVKRYRRNTAR